MNIAIRYYTRSGNTKKLAEAIANAVKVDAKDVTVSLTEKVDILFLGSSYYAFDVDEAVKKFVTENSKKIGKIVCFGTSAMMKSMIKPVKKVADAAEVQVAKEDFHCKGSFGPMHKGKPDENDLKRSVVFAKMIAEL